jgi:hypothetical protein
MIFFVFFWIYFLLAALYALARGGGPERITTLSFLVAGILTIFQSEPPSTSFRAVQWGTFAIDLTLFGILVVIALHADRFWTLWSAALQILGIGSHMVRLFDHQVIPLAYAVLMQAWAYPMIVLLIVGTFRHSRRQRLSGIDVDWSFRAAGHGDK